MSNLSELLPVGGGQNTADYVAKGTIGAGVAVTVNFDGTISAVSENNAAINRDIAYPDMAVNGFTDNALAMVSCYCPDHNAVLLAYRNTSQGNRLTIVVGSISGKKIVWGDQQTGSNSCIPMSIVWDDSQNRGIVAYRNSSNYPEIRAFTVSGNTVASIGNAVVVNSASSYTIPMTYYRNEGFTAIFYDVPGGTSPVGRVISGSGTTLSVSTSYQAPSVGGSYMGNASVTYKDAPPYNDPMVLAWNIDQATGVAVTVTMPSSTQLSYGTASTITSAFNAYENVIVLADAARDKYMYLVRSTNGGGTFGAVGSISAGNVTFGAATKISPSVLQFQTADFNYVNGNALLIGDNFGLGNKPSGYAFTIDGNEIKTSNVSPALASFRSQGISVCFVPSINCFAVFYVGYTGNTKGYMNIVETTKSSAIDAIGVSDGAISDGASGGINLLGGISGGHSGLTVGSRYYVQDDGTLGNNVTESYIGTAISTTDINLVNSI